MIELFLSNLYTNKPTIPIGKQTVAALSNNILPNSTFGYAYIKGANVGYVIGGRIDTTAVRKVIKIDLLTNALTVDSDIPASITNIDTASAAMVDNVIYCYTGWSFFKYDTVNKTFLKYPDFTDATYVTTAGQMEGSYKGKIYKCNKVGTNNFNILEYDTTTNTHSIFRAVVGITNIGYSVSSIVIDNMLYISDPQMSSNICAVNLDTKATALIPLPVNLGGVSSFMAYGYGRLFVFSDTTTVCSIPLADTSSARIEPVLINKRAMTGVFTNSGYMKSYIGNKLDVNNFLSYGIGE